MGNQRTKQPSESRVRWETLEAWVREHVQAFIQRLLEEQVTEFLGRQKSERRARVDAPAGYRNGSGKVRRVTLRCGMITVQRPRVRAWEDRFEMLFKRKSTVVEEVIPELYLHGLAQGDFELALRGLLGEEAPLSSTTMARLTEQWQTELAVWQSRRLDDVEAVYLWVDGIYVKAGLEKEKAALLTVLAALSDGRKVVMAIVPGHRESTASWAAVLRDLQQRWLRPPRLVIGDGHVGIWGALRNVYPEAEEQRCWNHKILNVLDKLPKRQQAAAKPLLCQIPYADTCHEAERRRERFARRCEQCGYLEAAQCLVADWDRMVTFHRFPNAHGQHLRTTNPVESPFAAARLRTDAAKRFKKGKNATAVIWKMLLVAARAFRRVKHPELMSEVYQRITSVDAARVETETAA